MQLQLTWPTVMNQSFSWLVREAAPAYGAENDVLLSELKVETSLLSRRVGQLSDLSFSLSPMEESKLVFQLEAVLDMRRELLRENGEFFSR